jgi:type II secretory pathway pseudopilin PulG
MLLNSSRWRVRTRRCDGYTLLELIFICAIIGLIAAIAVPTIFRSRMAANETAAVATMRNVTTAQLTYALTCGYGLYASSFPDLGSPTGDGYLPPELTLSPTPAKTGYNYDLVPGPIGVSGLADCNGNATSLDYYVTAVPIAIGDTGNRAFASNQGNVIWQDAAGVAPVEPFAIAVGVSPIQ